jgi:hypothetical protein
MHGVVQCGGLFGDGLRGIASCLVILLAADDSDGQCANGCNGLSELIVQFSGNRAPLFIEALLDDLGELPALRQVCLRFARCSFGLPFLLNCCGHLVEGGTDGCRFLIGQSGQAVRKLTVLNSTQTRCNRG